jgi:hypothetical protein
MTTMLLGTDCEAVRDLAAALRADLVEVPDVAAPAGIDWAWAGALEGWRASAARGPQVGSVVVAAWTDDPGAPLALDQLDLDGWVTRHEVPFARWFAAMGVAAARCADRGSIVAVAEQPAPLDCAGRADAVETLARSLARSEGLRGVRVNTVTTPARLTRPPVVLPPPPLASFPGAVTLELAGAVRALLGHDSVGITATTVHADCGRTGR